MKKMILILALLILSSASFAGGHVGNGGGVVKCPLKPHRLIDFAYGEMTSLEVTLVDLEENVQDFHHYLAFRRLLSLDANLTHKILSFADNFWGRVNWVYELPQLFDNPLYQPPFRFNEGCEYLTVSLFKREEGASKAYYSIHAQLWDMLSNVDQRGLIAHEILYSYAEKNYGHVNSDKTAMLNWMLHSDMWEKLSREEKMDILNDYTQKVTVRQ